MLALLAAILCNLSQPYPVQAQGAAASSVDQVVSLYMQGRFQEAELLALRTLQSSDSLPPVDRALLYKTLGFTYVVMRENEKAKNQFIAWLEIDPLADLDSVYISPKIIAVFREAQAELEARKRQAESPADEELTLRLGAVRRSVIFPGLGQIYCGKQIKGFSLMTSEIVLIGAFVFCQIQYDQKRDEYLQERNPNHMQDLYDEANLYYRAKYVSAILAAGVYLYSLYDAAYLSSSPSKKSPISLSVSPVLRSLLTLKVNF